MDTKTIPTGWEEIPRDAEILHGDMYFHTSHKEWRNCESSIGSTPQYEFLPDTPVIRKIAAKAKEKEWLNPWD